jgi:hypothetical protein
VDILPPTWMAYIKNEVGSASLPEREKRIRVEDCDQLCHLMKLLTTKAEESGLDMSREGYAMEGSFVTQRVMRMMPTCERLRKSGSMLKVMRVYRKMRLMRQ